MGSKTKVTVGIPTYNRASLLDETIRSVLGQQFADFRLVVSDNASDDGTSELVGSFADPRLAYVRSERNVGMIANLNRLIALTETEFLLLLPDDDIVYPGYLGSVDRSTPPSASRPRASRTLRSTRSTRVRPFGSATSGWSTPTARSCSSRAIGSSSAA